MVKRYIKDFKNFILIEQDMGMGMGMEEDGQQPAAPKQKFYSFIFLDDGKKISSTGPLEKRYNLYRIKETELDAWIDKSISSKKERLSDTTSTEIDKVKLDVKNAIIGERFSISNIDRSFLKKFKNDVKAGLIDGTDSVQHYKDKNNKDAYNSLETITVEFDKNNIPVTTELEVTFIETEK